MDKVNIEVSDKTQEIIFREGKAESIETAMGIVLHGTISSPADWYEGKLENGYEFDRSSMYIVHDIDNKSIQLRTKEHYTKGSVSVTGQLSLSTELNSFGINKGNCTSYGAKQLAQFLKMNRSYFVDRSQCMQIVSSLNQLKIKVEREIEDGNDFRGNKSVKFEQHIKSELALSFTLSIPIFKGFEASKFEVEILFDVTDAGINIWLESVELKELIDIHSNRIITAVLDRLRPLTIIRK